MSAIETETVPNQNEQTYSKIEFDKHNLFIRTLPNQIGYDSVTIKNTGKTCVYFKWQKKNTQFQLEDKRSDGFGKFYCHYSDNKIFPNEEKKFVFSFFSEKNGLFSEDWELSTSPPLTNCNLILHLNGMIHKYVDTYSDKIDALMQDIYKKNVKTNINEFVLDLVETIKEDEPPLPDMEDEKVFKFYYEYYNKEYNVVFTKKVMKDLTELNHRICDSLGIDRKVNVDDMFKEERAEEARLEEEKRLAEEAAKEAKDKGKKAQGQKVKKDDEDKNEEEEEAKRIAEEQRRIIEEQRQAQIDKQKEINAQIHKQRFWNGSIDKLKQRISTIPNDDDKYTYNNMLDVIIHASRKKLPEDSNIYNYVRGILLEQLENFNDTVNEIREEYLLPPMMFDALTRESLSEQELAKYDAEIKKKKDDYNKKSKKKPFKNAEEEQAELAEYKDKLYNKITQNILSKFDSIENDKLDYTLKQSVLCANVFNDEYIDRLCRVKTLRNVKNEGGIDNKYVCLRIDIEDYKREYVNEVDEDGNVIGQKFKLIDYLATKDKMFDSLNYLLNNGAKAVLLLLDFGPKNGNVVAEYTTKDLVNYIETAIDHPTFYAKSLSDLKEYNQKIDDEDLKDNCCIVMENLNFFGEECGFDNIYEEVINPNSNEEHLCLYYKNQFINALTGKTTIFINDSIFSFTKYHPTVIDVKVPLRVMGSKIDEQLKKLTDFFSIDSKEYLLIIGDNDSFITKGRNNLTNIINDNVNPLDIAGETTQLEYDDIKCFISSLLMINALMPRFKEICILGKLGLQFLQFIRKDYTLFDNSLYKVHTKLFKLMKYVLIKAHLNDVKVILPCDFKILNKDEYKKHLEPMYDSQGFTKDYTKEMKLLLKRERIQRQLEATYTDEDELNENADYLKIKLEDDQIEHLKLYKEKTVVIDRMPYCFDFIREFNEVQGISKPKKIFKTPIDVYLFNENIYDKEIQYPQEVIDSAEYYVKKEEMRLEKKKQMEEEQQKRIEEGGTSQQHVEQQQQQQQQQEQGSAVNDEQQQQQNENEQNENNTEQQQQQQSLKKKKPYDPRVYDYDNYELVDYGEATYNNVIESINKMNGVMWIGRLSPSKVENMFDNYPKIINAIHTRKKLLKEKFEEEQATQEKKLNEMELKARKQLLNVFMKSKSVYEHVKDNFKSVLNGTANNPIEELAEEDDVPQDEEQFNHDMHVLIDYFVNDDFELINSILQGEHITGFYGLCMEQHIEKEEEFDPKCLDEITN